MKEGAATRFTLNNAFIERQTEVKILGVWIGEDPSNWEKNTKEIVRRTYASMPMLTKLKYAGLSRQKLIHIYCLYIRSSTEYCSVAWHTNLTQDQSNSIERLQKVALKIILGQDSPRKEDGHFDYERALQICALKSLFARRENRMLDFGKKCLKHPTLKRLFPLNNTIFNDPHSVRMHELYHVNKARTVSYQDSAIPAIQRRLNQFYSYSPPV